MALLCRFAQETIKSARVRLLINYFVNLENEILSKKSLMERIERLNYSFVVR